MLLFVKRTTIGSVGLTALAILSAYIWVVHSHNMSLNSVGPAPDSRMHLSGHGWRLYYPSDLDVTSRPAIFGYVIHGAGLGQGQIHIDYAPLYAKPNQVALLQITAGLRTTLLDAVLRLESEAESNVSLVDAPAAPAVRLISHSANGFTIKTSFVGDRQIVDITLLFSPSIDPTAPPVKIYNDIIASFRFR